MIGLVAMPPVRAELAGAPTNRRTAKAANTPQQFDPWVHLSRAPGQRRADSGGSRNSRDPSQHGRRSGKAAGHGSGRVFGTHRMQHRMHKRHMLESCKLRGPRSIRLDPTTRPTCIRRVEHRRTSVVQATAAMLVGTRSHAAERPSGSRVPATPSRLDDDGGEQHRCRPDDDRDDGLAS